MQAFIILCMSTPLCESGTATEISKVSFMTVCLTLKREFTVGIPGAQETKEPLDEVNDIKQYIAQFPHLGGMYALMVE